MGLCNYHPPRPTGQGGADDGFDGTRGVPWNRLARHPGVIKTFLRAPHWVQHPRSPRANPNLTTYSVRRVTAFHRLLPQGREKWGNWGNGILEGNGEKGILGGSGEKGILEGGLKGTTGGSRLQLPAWEPAVHQRLPLEGGHYCP